jgi:two-component system response regulator NreC
VIRIVLADDHAVVRSGLRHVLGAEEDMEVVAEAGDVEETARKVRGHHPDVLVLDLNLGKESSLPAIPELSGLTRVVVLTMQDDPAFARRALADGAAGFVLKETAEGVLLDAVRQAAAGGTYLDPALGARLAAAPAGPPDGLTDRELEVLRLLALGHTNAEVAEQMFLSVRTVESHRAAVARKTSQHTRAELVRYALDHRLLEPGT